MWIVLFENINILEKFAHKRRREFYHRFMYIAPSSDHSMINLNLPFKVILRRFEVVSDVWSENAALFKRWMKSHSNPPITILWLQWTCDGLGICNLLSIHTSQKAEFSLSFKTTAAIFLCRIFQAEWSIIELDYEFGESHVHLYTSNADEVKVRIHRTGENFSTNLL